MSRRHHSRVKTGTDFGHFGLDDPEEFVDPVADLIGDELPVFTEALCAQVDPELFFPTKGGSTKTAKGLCASCADLEVCREYAIPRPDEDGIWGGTAPLERRVARSGSGSVVSLTLRERVTLRESEAVSA